MPTRTVTGTIHHPDGSDWASGVIKFHLVSPFETSLEVYPQEIHSETLDSSGAFSITLGVPDTGTAHYEIITPDNAAYTVYLASGAATDLMTLITIASTAVDQDAVQTLLDTHVASMTAHPVLAVTELQITPTIRPELIRLSIGEGDNDGIINCVKYDGWNYDAGSKINAALPAIWQQLECDYYTGGKHYHEWSHNTYTTDLPVTPMRWMAFSADRDLVTDAYWQFFIGTTGNSQFSVLDRATTGVLFQVDGVNGQINLGKTTEVRDSLTVAGAGSGTADKLSVYPYAYPTTTYFAMDLAPVIYPTQNILVGTFRSTGNFILPAAVAFNTVRTTAFIAPTISFGAGGTLNYSINVDIQGAPTGALYGNWALHVDGIALYDSYVGFGLTLADAPTAGVDVGGNTIRVRTAKTPATAGAAGNAGDICWDASYIYVCTATNTWKRAEIATWV